MIFRNQIAFDDPRSRMAASGVDLRASHAITDPRGRVIAHAQTGGMLSPTRFEIQPGAKLFRFGNLAAGVARVAGGSWWLEQGALDKLVRFAQVWDLSVGAAMRFLCLVPPEWSEASLLVRARAVDPLLAWRGLANSVVTPAAGGGPAVRMPDQNELSERRLHQLYIPGVSDDPRVRAGLAVEQDYPLDPAASKRGFLYV